MGSHLALADGEPGSQQLAARVALSGRRHLVKNFASIDATERRPGTRSELAVPLSDGKATIGVLDVESDGLAAFDLHDAKALEALAELAVIAIQGSLRLAQLEEAKQLVNARSALAWLGIGAADWRHGASQSAGQIRNRVARIVLLLEQVMVEWTKSPGSNIKQELDEIIEIGQRLMERPEWSRDSASAGITSVPVNNLLHKRIQQELWKNEPYLQARLKLDPQLDRRATVSASVYWLKRVLEILIDNAIEVPVPKLPRRITVSSRAVGTNCEIVVADNGCGIPPGLRAKLLLEPIPKEAGDKGLGMGLLAAQAVLQLYRGSLRIEDNLPTGTRMIITLPLERPPLAADPSQGGG